MKEKLTSSPILGFPRFGSQNEGFRLYTNASNEAISGILAHVQGDEEVVIAYTGRDLKNCEKKSYCTSEKKARAIVASIKKFDHYLQCGQFNGLFRSLSLEISDVCQNTIRQVATVESLLAKI